MFAYCMRPPRIQECSLTPFLSFRSLEQHHSGPQEEFPEISRSKFVILFESMSGIAMKYIHILIFFETPVLGDQEQFSHRFGAST